MNKTVSIFDAVVLHYSSGIGAKKLKRATPSKKAPSKIEDAWNTPRPPTDEDDDDDLGSGSEKDDEEDIRSATISYSCRSLSI